MQATGANICCNETTQGRWYDRGCLHAEGLVHGQTSSKTKTVVYCGNPSPYLHRNPSSFHRKVSITIMSP